MENRIHLLAAVVMCVLINAPIDAQKINWNTAPRKGFVFQISNKEAQRLLTRCTSDTIFSGLLHTQVDTFDVKKGWNHRPAKGHFILATIKENKLHCEYTSIFPYQVFLLQEYNALSLQVLDLDGNVREDAIVKFKVKKLRLDPESKTYRIENAWFSDESRFVTVELDGFRSVFNIEKHEVPTWYNDYSDNEGPLFYSYMITDKNKYRPNEKVRFKSYALSQSRSPMHRELDVWLSYGGESKKVAKVKPHRPGSYASEFVLHDSLKLTLDRNYNLQLRERSGRVVANCNFKYEDYELDGNKLDIHLASDRQYYPAQNKLSILATDVNGLMLKDAKASVLVKSRSIQETFQSVVILKDTLLFKEIDLDPKEPTTLEIPSELFLKTNTVYDVSVSIRSSQNQLQERTISAKHYYSEYELTSRFSNDSIVYELLKNGKLVSDVPVKLSHDGEVKMTEIRLPYKEKINPVISTVHLKSDFVSREISMSSITPLLEVMGGIKKDSFDITLNNPQKLDVSWYIYQGSELLQKGFGNKLKHKSFITDRTQTYYVEILYSFGGEDRLKRKDFEFREDYLSVLLDIPERVYPGQQVDAIIKVVDQSGRPMNGVDLTAMAVNAKLSYYLPDLPYYGSISSPRSQAATYSKDDINKRSAILDLDYEKWAKRAGLDTMRYYQFTYPKANMFSYSYGISDSTQFAPYVMQNGIAKQVYVVEVNRNPVYYAWVDQPKAYSFYAPTKSKASITLRLFDRVLIFDSIQFAPGKKTILSIDLDHLPANVNVYNIDLPTKKTKRAKVFPSFTPTEISRHSAYLSSFAYAEGYASLGAGKLFIPLFSPRFSSHRASITAGPILPAKWTFSGANGLKITYRHVGGFTYSFEDNVVYKAEAKNLFPDQLFNRSFKPMNNINDLVITKNAFLEYGESPENLWYPRSINLVDNSTYIKVLLPSEKAGAGFASFLFENCATKKIVSPCQARSNSNADLNIIPRGWHNVVAVYNNGSYLKMDSINLKSYSKVVIDLSQSTFNKEDSLSRRWRSAVSRNCHPQIEPRVVTFRHSMSSYGNIKGTVYSAEDNSPLPGVNVVIKGTMVGTVSDADGRFAIDTDESLVTLVISFIGMETREVEVNVGSDVTIYLKADVKQLSEVVVVGYGVETKRELLAASTVLYGKVSGLVISKPDVDELDEGEVQKQEGTQRLYTELLELSTIRSHFNDVGFWEPKLFTDKQGQSKFRVAFPDDITRWDATVYAMNRHLQTGTTRKSIKSYKPVVAELFTPQFLTQGDSAFFIGKVSNYTNERNITGKAKWTSSASSFEKEIEFNDFHVDKLPVIAATTDSVTASYVLNRDDGFRDGELRKVPVVEQGIVRADGTLSILKANDVIHIKASDTESITVEVLANPIDIFVGEARYLLNYKYDCNEQLASKLLGLINYRILMKYENKEFKHDRDVNKIIARLLGNQNRGFLWSWWDRSASTSYWISSHILRALKVAKEAGYTVDLNVENVARKAEYKFNFLHEYALSDADLLNALASWNAKIDYSRHLAILDTLIRSKEKPIRRSNRQYDYRYSLLKEKFLIQETRQLVNLSYSRDTLLRYRKEGILGTAHFSDGKASTYWYDDELSVNAIAYRIVKRDSLLNKFVVPMQVYFLSERSKNDWNTYHSSNVLTSVFADLVAQGVSKNQTSSIELTGKVNRRLQKFPYQIELLPGEELNLRMESSVPVYFMQYKKVRVTKAKTGVEGFAIKTAFGNDQAILYAGKPITVNVEVAVTKDARADYVMIEVPIPGSCSYADKTQTGSHVETHREYFYDRTVIFCENMKPGKYSFSVQLLPRFTGKYIVNPSQVSLMYFPVVNANTEMKKLSVK